MRLLKRVKVYSFGRQNIVLIEILYRKGSNLFEESFIKEYSIGYTQLLQSTRSVICRDTALYNMETGYF